jgi:hypothetical protein
MADPPAVDGEPTAEPHILSLRGEYGNPDALTDATVDRYFDFARVRAIETR